MTALLCDNSSAVLGSIVNEREESDRSSAADVARRLHRDGSTMAASASPLPVSLRRFFWMAREETARAPFPWREKLRWWPRGFYAESASLYDLSPDDADDYLNDCAHLRLRKINPVRAFFDHKLLMRVALLQAGFAQAETVAAIGPDVIQLFPLDDRRRFVSRGELEQWLLEDGGPFIIKPENLGRGRGVALIERVDGTLVQRRGPDTHPFRVPSSGGVTLIERALVQGDFWRRLNPSSSNSIRIATMWTPGDPAPFVGMASQRIGTAATAPTDNFSLGGLCARVDLQTGRLGTGRRRVEYGGGARVAFPRHPDTGAAIEGEILPAWDKVCDTVVRATETLPFIRYAAWDVLVDDSGTPVIIEGNNNGDLDVFQVHGGLLRDPRVRRFYETCKVL
jgi:hypothetical protein